MSLCGLFISGSAVPEVNKNMPNFTFLLFVYFNHSSCFYGKHDQFKVALEAALRFFPNINLKEEQEICIRSLVSDQPRSRLFPFRMG